FTAHRSAFGTSPAGAKRRNGPPAEWSSEHAAQAAAALIDVDGRLMEPAASVAGGSSRERCGFSRAQNNPLPGSLKEFFDDGRASRDDRGDCIKHVLRSPSRIRGLLVTENRNTESKGPCPAVREFRIPCESRIDQLGRACSRWTALAPGRV